MFPRRVSRWFPVVHGGDGVRDRKQEAVRRPLPVSFHLIVMPAVSIVNPAVVLVFGPVAFDRDRETGPQSRR